MSFPSIAQPAWCWTALLTNGRCWHLRRIERKPVRFNELKREIEGVSQKVLSQTLKRLERDGLIIRKAFPTVPVTVEYSISPLGQTLTQVATAISVWAENNIAAVVEAQQRYDAAQQPVA